MKVPEQLSQLVATRKKWVDAVGSVFEEKQRESPGRIWGLPKSSVYEGLEDDAQEFLRAGPDAPLDLVIGEGSSSSKGKGKARQVDGDYMDIG